MAPNEYNAQYMDQLVRTLSELIEKTELPVRNIPYIPDVAELATLEVGDLYKDASGFVKIKT